MNCSPLATSRIPWLAPAATLFWLVSLAVAVGHAQETPALEQTLPVTPPPTGLTVEVVQQRLKEVDVLPNLEDAAREELRGIFQEAIRDLTAAAEFAKQAAVFAEMAKDVPARLEAAKSQLSAIGATVTIDVPPDATLAELERLLKSEEEKLAAAKRQKEQLEAEPGRRQVRRAEIPVKVQGLSETRQRLAGELAALPATTEPKVIAQRTGLAAKITAVDQELKLYEQELAAYTATKELLDAQQDLTQDQTLMAEKRVVLWREAVKKRRDEEVKQQEAIARTDAEETKGVLKPLAIRNSELAQRSSQLAKDIDDVKGDLANSVSLLEKTQAQFKVTKEKVDRVGLSYAIGLLLRKEDAALPDVSIYRRSSRKREDLIRDVELRIIDLREERFALKTCRLR